jgi:molecular chaperone HscA
MFFTWAINHSLANDFGDEIPRNIKRRFAMPCFPRPNARKVEAKLKTMLGEAQVLADTFNDIMHDGVPLHDFLIALKKLRSEKRTYSFIDCSVTEPLGVAGSLLSWNNNSNSLVLVVDIGAGTSDFSLYRLKVDIVDDHTVRSTAGEVDGTARGISEAGNHLDKILMGLILRKSGINTNNPRYRNVTHALERDIRNYKESLFSPTAEATITLYNGDPVDVTLEEFLAEPAVKSFERSLRETMVNILESAHEDWVNWVRAHPSRRLTIVLTGGGSTLPMVRKLAEGTVTAHGITIPVAAAKSFPEWLRDDFPDLEEHYPRVAVSLGGARKHTIQSMGVLKSTGISGEREYKLERFVTRGV